MAGFEAPDVDKYKAGIEWSASPDFLRNHAGLGIHQKIDLAFDANTPLSPRARFDRFSTRANIPEVSETRSQLFSTTGRESRSLNLWKTILIGGFVVGEAGSLATAGLGIYRDRKGIGDPKSNKRLKIVGGLGTGMFPTIFCGLMEGMPPAETAPAPFELTADNAVARIQEVTALTPNGTFSDISCGSKSGEIQNISFVGKDEAQKKIALCSTTIANVPGMAEIKNVPIVVSDTGDVFVAGRPSIGKGEFFVVEDKDPKTGEDRGHFEERDVARFPLFEITKDGKLIKGPGSEFEAEYDIATKTAGPVLSLRLHDNPYSINKESDATATIPMMHAFLLADLMKMNTTKVLEVAFTAPRSTQAPSPTETPIPPTPTEIPGRPAGEWTRPGMYFDVAASEWAYPNPENPEKPFYYKTVEGLVSGWFWDAGGGQLMDDSILPKFMTLNIWCEEGLQCPEVQHIPYAELPDPKSLTFSNKLFTVIYDSRFKKIYEERRALDPNAPYFEEDLNAGKVGLPFVTANDDRYVYKISPDTSMNIFLTAKQIINPDRDWQGYQTKFGGDGDGNFNVVESFPVPVESMPPKEFMSNLFVDPFMIFFTDDITGKHYYPSLDSLLSLATKGDHPYFEITP